MTRNALAASGLLATCRPQGGVSEAARWLALPAVLALFGCGGGGSNQAADSQGASAAVQSTPYTGRGWFVDAAAGNDAASGSADSPWKTLARASQQTLARGDALLLKCGGTWRESLALAVTNTPAGGAILGAWGNDCSDSNLPIISGADPVPGTPWTVSSRFGGKPVYVTNWPRPVSALYWNGSRLIRARYPNYAGIGHEFSLLDSVTGAGTLVVKPPDAAALSGLDLTGTTAFIRTSPWWVEPAEVAGSGTPGVIALRAPTNYPPQAAEGYFIEGSLGLLDAPGEWFYDPASAQLYVWTPDGNPPASATIETVVRDFGVTIAGVADTRVDRIAFQEQAQAALRITDAQGTGVTALSSRDAGRYGVLVEGATNDQSRGTSIRQSTITGAAVDGISATSPAVEIVANRIEATGVGADASGVSAGVYVQSVGGSVRDNRISDSAYAAILLANAAGITVAGNSLVQACRRFTDCGAIYSAGAPTADQRTSITSNAINDMAANAEGAVGGGNTLVAGVYLDEDSANHDVVGNLIDRVVVGINLHNSANHLLQSNHVWLADEASIRVHNSLATDRVRGNLIQDNELYASSDLVASQPATTAPAPHIAYAQEWVHGSDARLMFAGKNPNVVRRNVVGSMTAPEAVRWQLISGLTPRALVAAEWRAYASSESTRAAYPARPFIVTRGGENLVENGRFQLPGAGWLLSSATALASGSLTYGSCGASGCADYAPVAPGNFLTSNTFQMSSAAGASLYQLQVRAQAVSPGDASLSMAINRADDGSVELGAVLKDQPIGSDQETTLATLFNATGSDPARLNMTALPGTTIRLREVTVAPVASYELLSPGSESELLANESAAAKQVDCPSTRLRTCVVSGLSGEAITWPLTLAPNRAIVVVSADAKWKP